jgi:cytochrome c-type biogenesis protein CcmH/NrfG
MNITDELERLSKLRKDGTLNEEEFAKAKNNLLSQQDESRPSDRSQRENSFHQANDRFLSMQVVVIGSIILLAIVLAVLLPHWHFHHHFYP